MAALAMPFDASVDMAAQQAYARLVASLGGSENAMQQGKQQHQQQKQQQQRPTRPALSELSANTAEHVLGDRGVSRAFSTSTTGTCATAAQQQHHLPAFCAPEIAPYPVLQQQQQQPAAAPPQQAPPPPPPQQQPWVDIDARSAANPLACADLAPSIFDDLRRAELDPSLRPTPLYSSDLSAAQPDMTPGMRAILVDWLVEVAQEYRLCSDTLFLAVAALDRFLSRCGRVPRERLQLAGVACMWLASKYEEIYAPGSRDFVYITDGTYTRQELVEAEGAVLAALSFRLTQPTAKTFLRRHLQAAAADERLHYLSSYLCELSLLSERALGMLPSQVAAASVYCASLLLQGGGGNGGGVNNNNLSCPWTPTLERYTGWTLADLQPAVCELLSLHEAMSATFAAAAGAGAREGDENDGGAAAANGNAAGGAGGVAQNTATRDKYASSKLLRVSEIPPLSMQRPALAMSFGIYPGAVRRC